MINIDELKTQICFDCGSAYMDMLLIAEKDFVFEVVKALANGADAVLKLDLSPYLNSDNVRIRSIVKNVKSYQENIKAGL